MAENLVAMEPVVIETFGGLRIRRGDTVIRSFRSERTAAVLASLAQAVPRPVLRDTLVARIWPEDSAADGRRRLSTALWSLRTEIEALGLDPRKALILERTSAALAPESVATDLAAFERAAGAVRDGATSPRLATELVRLYQGEFLLGMYHDWVLVEQQRLAELFQRTALSLAERLETAGEIGPAIDLLRRAVEEDPLGEETSGSLMRLYAKNGQPDAALGLYRGLVRRRREELDADTAGWLDELARDITEGKIVAVRPKRDEEPPPLESQSSARLYVVRRVDEELERILTEDSAREHLLLVKGPRQTGKTSLVLRGLAFARKSGWHVAMTDLRALSEEQVAGYGPILRALAGELAEQLDLDPTEAAEAVGTEAPGRGLRRYLRQAVLRPSQPPLVWAIDELDRLLPLPYAPDVLGLMRAWYNERALDPGGPWSRLVLILAYSTEAHLFVRDLNQSPFNVGRTLPVDDFSPDEVHELHRRHGSPLPNYRDVARLAALVDGHPGLLRRALRELARETIGLDELERMGERGGGIFAGHLQRLGLSLAADPELRRVLEQLLRGAGTPQDEAFLRLRSAGVLTGVSAEEARLRCRLYESYFRRRLCRETPT